MLVAYAAHLHNFLLEQSLSPPVPFLAEQNSRSGEQIRDIAWHIRRCKQLSNRILPLLPWELPLIEKEEHRKERVSSWAASSALCVKSRSKFLKCPLDVVLNGVKSTCASSGQHLKLPRELTHFENSGRNTFLSTLLLFYLLLLDQPAKRKDAAAAPASPASKAGKRRDSTSLKEREIQKIWENGNLRPLSSLFQHFYLLMVLIQ